jgi:hypothetical protein
MSSRLTESAIEDFAIKLFGRMQNLDKSDPEIDKVWAEEALRRTQACDAGRMKTVPFEEVFGGK